MKKLVILLGLVLALYGNSFKNAIKLAKKTDRLILVEIHSEYCKYSQNMRKKVFKDQGVRKLIRKNYVLFRVNIDRDIRGLPKHLYTERTPTYYFLSSDGKKTVEEIIGEMKKKDFIWFLRETYIDCHPKGKTRKKDKK